MSMDKMNTEDLVRLIDMPLVEWRRLPVKHPQQIAQRDMVIKSFETLRDRLVNYEKLLHDQDKKFSDIENIVFGDIKGRSWVDLLEHVKKWRLAQDDASRNQDHKSSIRHRKTTHFVKQFPSVDRHRKSTNTETLALSD